MIFCTLLCFCMEAFDLNPEGRVRFDNALTARWWYFSILVEISSVVRNTLADDIRRTNCGTNDWFGSGSGAFVGMILSNPSDECDTDDCRVFNINCDTLLRLFFISVACFCMSSGDGPYNMYEKMYSKIINRGTDIARTIMPIIMIVFTSIPCVENLHPPFLTDHSHNDVRLSNTNLVRKSYHFIIII